jgi:hypothetical protein
VNATPVFSTAYIIWLMLGKVSYIWHAAFIGLNISDDLHYHAWTLLTGSVISGFHHEVDENCALLGYAMNTGNFLLTVWNNLSIPSSKFKNKKKILTLEKKGTICCPEMFIQNYHYSLHNNPKDSSSYTQWNYHDFQNSTYKNNRKLTH